ncbi:MAG: hypothetical protein GY862_33875, partial [Gammaproteobacteria bacterium]|nr:hypothetical protein [Gammaproteobacteria bacterium]
MAGHKKKKTGKGDKKTVRATKELTQVLAAPGATALRQPWRDETGELSPARLAMIMRAAIEGDAEAY